MRRTNLITGASSGLGAGMARELAARGRDLVLCARRTDMLETLAAELRARHPAARTLVESLDVNDHSRVFAVFRASAEALGGLDRVIVNAGIGDGRRIGTGHFDGNLRTVETNFVAALAQCEAAVEIFRAQNHGHLVTISSMSAMRGLPRHLTSYAASKAALTSLTEGIRAELLRTPIAVSVIHPGYIRTELNETAPPMLFEIDERKGASLLVRAIEKEPASACVPAWPWVAMGAFMRWAPISVVARMV
jgi:short-subunit dehydrogenase